VSASRAIGLLVAGVALATCTTAGSAKIPGCYKGPCVKIGEAQDLPGIRVIPLAVLTDDRCPIEADCATPDKFVLKARLDMGHETIEMELPGYEPVRINGGMLTLAEIAPDSSIQWLHLKPGDYAFRFTFVPDMMDQVIDAR